MIGMLMSVTTTSIGNLLNISKASFPFVAVLTWVCNEKNCFKYSKFRALSSTINQLKSFEKSLIFWIFIEVFRRNFGLGIGISTLKVVPWPALVLKLILPFKVLTIFLVIYRPNPTPPSTLFDLLTV